MGMLSSAESGESPRRCKAPSLCPSGRVRMVHQNLKVGFASLQIVVVSDLSEPGG